MKILAIETSCDETAVAVVEDGTKVLSNVIASQIARHAETGGVVPEVAAREHIKVMMPVLGQAFKEAGLKSEASRKGGLNEGWDEIDAIAVTKEPGLVGSLIVGRMTAAALAFSKDLPLIEVNHIHGHIYANWLEASPPPQFPVLTLTVSGGHNELVLLRGHGDFHVLGETVDDAAGEAFDKVARLLHLGYPGGPIIEERAKEGNPKAVRFPRAMPRGYNFSFSGLKTAVYYYLREHEQQMKDENFVNDVAASFQDAVVEALVKKLMKAVKEFSPKEVHLSGGVSANRYLRGRTLEALSQIRMSQMSQPPIFRFPKKMSYCTDNAAMIGAAGYFMR